ncbi:MAG: ABC transporter ATP-binding protein [Acetobacteraceae bacterium]|nr:ABC transporter ATP-binding protein [Acetobacteraceae bacterium]
MSGALVEAQDLGVRFAGHGGLFGAGAQSLHAVQGANLSIERGEVLGLVGESGSGKTTTGRALLRLVKPTAGSVRFDGVDITGWNKPALRPLRRRMQMIFQDPYSSLDPRLKVRDIIGEAFVIHGIGTARDRPARVASMLERVGLPADAMDRYPHEFSGGQRQRVGIARALAVGPEFVIADEPVSALDVSVQAQVLNLLLDLQRALHLTMLFIAHDLAVVQYVSDRVAVMYLGRIMEVAPNRELFARPRHPYTAALLEAAPMPDPSRRHRVTKGLIGEIPSPFNPPSGCVFRSRCPYALPACAETVPALTPISAMHAKACIRDDVP